MDRTIPTEKSTSPAGKTTRVERRVPVVGDTLHFCVSESPFVVRPFIACAIMDLRVTGLLVFASEADRALPWVQLWSKQQPAHDQPACWVSASHGFMLGEWLFPFEREQDGGEEVR